MSFSFNVRAQSKDQALEAVNAKLDEVVAQQPIHEKDRNRAQAAVEEYLLVVPEPGEGQELSVTVGGSIGTIDDVVASVGVNVSISIFTPIAG